jgi:hypothetical protein
MPDNSSPDYSFKIDKWYFTCILPVQLNSHGKSGVFRPLDPEVFGRWNRNVATLLLKLLTHPLFLVKREFLSDFSNTSYNFIFG